MLQLRVVAAVQNGLALCSLHHAAYDRNILRISPDCEIRIAGEWIEKNDPFAQMALTAFDGRRLTLPRDSAQYPNRECLASRFET
jgi:putative restriction endonuclease